MDADIVVRDALKAGPTKCPDCSDLDDECGDVTDKVACWLHAPELGMCPFLRPAAMKDSK